MNFPSYETQKEDALIEARASRIAKMSREQLEAEFGKMSDAEFAMLNPAAARAEADRLIENEADRLAGCSRSEIEAVYGPLSDEEFAEIFG